MKKSSPSILGTVVFVLTVLARLTIEVEAQSFLATPTIVELEVLPGEEKDFVIRVINVSVHEQSFRVYLTDLALEKDGNPGFPLPGSSTWSCASWITIRPSRLILTPYQGTEIACKLSVPRGETGGRYAAIIVEQTQKPALLRDRIIPEVRYRIAISILLTVRGAKLEEKVQISEIKVTLSQEGKNEVIVRVRNEGNVHVRGEGIVIVKDAYGRIWKEVTLEAGKGTILPQSERNFKGIFENPLLPGKYTVEAIIAQRTTNGWGGFLARKRISYVVKEAFTGSNEE